MLNSINNNNYDNIVQQKPQKKITPQRLKNIGLYYLKRFESSIANLRNVLRRRVILYAKENPEFNKQQAFEWIEDILNEFVRMHYLDDNRFAEIKIRSYLNAGKPARYIQNKLKEKGINDEITAEILAKAEYDPFTMALRLAKRKKIGPYRQVENKFEHRQKDMGILVRAGFDYDIVCQVLDCNIDDKE